MKTITGTCCAWISSSYVNSDPEDLSNLHITDLDMEECGWVRVGTATVSVEYIGRDEQIKNRLAMLDEAERRVNADAQVKINEIQVRRQRLMAIEHKG